MADRRALQLPPPVLGVLALTPELFDLTLETAPERGCCRPMRRRRSQRDAAVGVGHFPLEQIEAGLVRGEMVRQTLRKYSPSASTIVSRNGS